MQKAFIFCFFVLLSLPALSQDIWLGLYPVKVPHRSFSSAQENALQTKLRAWISAAGMSVADKDAPVGISPELVFGQARKVEAGLKTLTVVEADLMLSLQQAAGNPVFDVYTKKLTGTGNDEASAKKDLLSKLPVKDPGFEVFLDQSLPKITAYFDSRCQEITQSAEGHWKQNQPERALSLLANIPASVPCHESVKPLFERLYSQHRDAICKKNLLLAKAAAAKKDYDGAVRALGHIDPGAACFAEAESFLAELKTSADADFLAKLETVKTYYVAKANLEEHRFGIVRGYLLEK